MSYPLTHARIGYDSIGTRATISASAAITGYPASAAANGLTFSYWSAAPPATWEMLLAAAEEVNYFGIAAHTLYTNNCVAVLQAFIDEAWVTMAPLTPIGDIWRFDGDLYGLRGGAPTTTGASLRRGAGADGRPVRRFYDVPAGTDYSGADESKFGTHSMTIEPAVTNLFPSNVRTGGDTNGDLTDFNSGASDAAYSTDRSVSGAGSIKITDPGSGGSLVTDPVSCGSNTNYTVSCKLQAPQPIPNVTISLVGDVSGNLGSVTYDDIPTGVWNILTHTEQTGASDTTIAMNITIDDESCYVDELQLELGTTAFTWADGTRAAGDLAYQPEILQQIKDDCTVNVWVRMPSTADGQSVIAARSTGGNENTLYLLTPTGGGKVRVSTSDADGNFQNLDHTYTWDGEWHMITAVVRPGVSGEDNKFLYVDGRLAESTETTRLPTWAEIGVFYAGHSNGLSRLGKDGESLMDDLVIVNRAFSATEIKAWYDSGVRLDAEEVGISRHEDDRPIMRVVEAATSHRFRVRVVGQTTPVIGVIYAGKALEMERPLYGGHSPISLNRRTVVRPNVSERGQFLGRSIIRSGAGGSWSWRNLTAAWVRRYLDPFIESARTTPFFILWRPWSFPGEAGYCWTMDDMAPVNVGTRDLMSFTLDAEGLGHE